MAIIKTEGMAKRHKLLREPNFYFLMAVAPEGKIAAGHLYPEAVAWQERLRRRPQVHLKTIDLVGVISSSSAVEERYLLSPIC